MTTRHPFRHALAALVAAGFLTTLSGGAAAGEGTEVAISELGNGAVGDVPYDLAATVDGDIGPEGYTYTWTPGDRCEVAGQAGAQATVVCEYVSGQDIDAPPRVFTVQVFDGEVLLGSAEYRLWVQGTEITTGHDNPDEDLILRGRVDSYLEDGQRDTSIRDVEIEARWLGTDVWEPLATVQTDRKGRFTYRLYPLDRALDLRARYGDAQEVVEDLKVRTDPRVRYDRRDRTAVVTITTVFGVPVAGFKARLFQYRWVVGEPRSMYLARLGTERTDADGQFSIDVPRWKHSPEYWVGLVENPEFNEVKRCFRTVAPQACA